MNTEIRSLAAAFAALLSLQPATAAAAEKPETKARAEMRVLSSPERRVIEQRSPDKGEKETVAFLGVETGPVSATTGAQLGLARGTGLVVNHVVSKSPAAGVLQEHDILLKLDDQILIETRQLAVLVRIRKPGEEVTVTYLRAGQKTTAKVTLGQQEVSKLSGLGGVSEVRTFAFTPATPGGPWFEAPVAGAGGGNREEIDRVLSMIHGARTRVGVDGQQSPMRIQIDRQGGPGFRAMSINTADSSLVFTDDEGSLELIQKAGAKTLVAKDAKGAEIFSGPVTTPEERKALPDAVRARLEKLEGMQDVTFRTDSDFKGTETKVVRPLERNISLPRQAAPLGVRRPALL